MLTNIITSSYQLHGVFRNKEVIFVGAIEKMAKEDVNCANGCDKVGMSDANVEATSKTFE